MKKPTKSNKGITLITLVITVIVIAILASVATYSGIEVINSSKLTRFTTEMKLIQTKVNEIYEDREQYKVLGSNTNSDKLTTIFDSINIEWGYGSDTNKYKYFSKDEIKIKLNIEDIQQEGVFIDFDNRKVVSANGITVDGTTYYVLEQLPNSLYNVDYIEKSEEQPTFNVTYDYIGNNKFRIKVMDINYNGQIQKWKVKYKKEDVANWSSSDDLEFIVNQEGTYIIKIQNGNVESDEKKISLKSVSSRFSKDIKYLVDNGLALDVEDITEETFFKIMKKSENILTIKNLRNFISSSNYSSTYDGEKAFDGNNSTYWCTSSGSQNNAYIGYNFENKQKIYGVSVYSASYLCKEVKLQCSNDNNTWIDASDVITFKNIIRENVIVNTKVNEGYQYWRLYIISGYNTEYTGVNEIEFYYPERQVEMYLTNKEENTISNSNYSSAYNANKAFDNSKTTYWYPASGGQNDVYVGYDFENAKKVNGVHFYSKKEYACKEVKLQCSNDNNTWIDASDVITLENSDKINVIKNTKITDGYRYWRIYIISSYSYPSIVEARFYYINSIKTEKVNNISEDIISMLVVSDETLELDNIITKSFLRKVVNIDNIKKYLMDLKVVDKFKDNDVDIIPTLTNNTNVISSSTYNGKYDKYKAFDKLDTTYWCTAQGKQNNAYIGYDFNKKTYIHYVKVYNSTSYRCKEVKLQCSNDNNTWIDASDVITLENTSDIKSIESAIKDEAYQYWRLYIISGYDSEYAGVVEIRFYGL